MKSFRQRVLDDATDWAGEGEGMGGVPVRKTAGSDIDQAIGQYEERAMQDPGHKASDKLTQEKIAFAEEDGGAEFDEGGANVATKDKGHGSNLYAADGPPLIKPAVDDEDDDEPEDRSTIGTEGEEKVELDEFAND